MNKKVAFAILLIALCIAFSSAQQSTVFHQYHVASVDTNSIYLQVSLKYVNWGFVSVDTYNNQTFNVTNVGSTPFMLNMTSEDWNPSNCTDYISVSWNLEGVTLYANETQTAILTLYVSPFIHDINDFTFTICVNAVESA